MNCRCLSPPISPSRVPGGDRVSFMSEEGIFSLLLVNPEPEDEMVPGAFVTSRQYRWPGMVVYIPEPPWWKAGSQRTALVLWGGNDDPG